jgi:hypothetical protein
MRLQRYDLRAVATRQRNPMAVHSSSAPGNCAPLHRGGVQHRSGIRRNLWTGSHDGRPHSEQAYRAKEPRGRPFLHAAEYEPFPEAPDADFPYLLSTGRTLYHFHTRTKTARLSCRRQRPRCGSRSARRTQRRPRLPRGISSRSSRAGGRCRGRSGSAASATGSSSCLSSTARGTSFPGPRAGPPTN